MPAHWCMNRPGKRFPTTAVAVAASLVIPGLIIALWPKSFGVNAALRSHGGNDLFVITVGADDHVAEGDVVVLYGRFPFELGVVRKVMPDMCVCWSMCSIAERTHGCDAVIFHR